MLEDNRVILSSMRSNRFHLHFAVDINKWDKDLALLSETIEMIIQVSRFISLVPFSLRGRFSVVHDNHS